MTFRVARTARKWRNRRLVLLRGFLRADGKISSFAVRALFDSGAEANFIAPSLVRKIGARITKGEYGVAVEAFGKETPLSELIENLEISFRGAQEASGLGQEFSEKIEVIVSPRDFGPTYELLLGTPFLDSHKADLKFGARRRVRLTGADGATTTFEQRADSEDEDGRAEPRAPSDELARDDGADYLQEAAGIWGIQAVRHMFAPIRIAALRAARPATGAQKREARREQRDFGEEDTRRAERAARERPDLVMTPQQLEECCARSTPGTVKVYPILSMGMVQDRSAQGPRVALNRLAHSATPAGAPEGDEGAQGQLPIEERAQAEELRAKLVAEFPDVFTSDLPALPKDSAPPDDGVHIVLKEGAHPVGRYGPRMSQADTQEAARMLAELIEKGFIRPSRSPWGAPMFLVDKPDGTKRMVIDYRMLNAATVRNRYPLPRADELFDQLQGAQYFSKVDLRTGYWQIRMAADAVEKTAFTSRQGHFEWLVLPMGLTNAPAEFMALMETTFREELNKFVLVFLDDILIYSRTLEEHEAHLRAAMGRLRAAKLHAKLSKCSFFHQEVEFLGHYVGRAGVRMIEGKVAAVQQWPTPTKQKEVEQFIGLAGYYRRFIRDFSKIASPLTELCGALKKKKGGGAERAPPKKTFFWGDEQQRAFEALKEAVTRAPCLAMPDPDKEFIVHTDASGYATGAVLMQKFAEGLRPIAFLLKKMKKAERNYPVYEQELLAILNALRAWRHYLGGRHFTVWTDHQSLQYVEASAMATPRQVRWATWLSEFDFNIKYTPGETNVVADGLSRAGAGPARAGLLISAVSAMAPMPIRIKRAAVNDARYQELLARSASYLARKNMEKASGLLYRRGDEGTRLVVPDDANLRAWMLSWAHDALEGGHRGGGRMAEWLKARVWWANLQKDAEKYARGCEECQRGKPDQRGRQGLPMSIDTPQRAGEVICVDFVGPLPRAIGGHTSIMVVVDKLTRYTVCVPLGAESEASAQEVFRALDRHWLTTFGVPRAIISDRDSRFTSRFWEDLMEQMRVELKRSTAWHPQTDGSTERANRVLIEALRAYVDEQGNDWAMLLPQMQRATNSSVCASTGYSPDYMMFGREMRSGLDADLEQDGVPVRDQYPGARQIHERRAAAEESARTQIEKAQARQRATAAQGRRAPEIQVGGRVWLSNKNLRDASRPAGARKLGPLYYGPYKVLAMHGSNAARVELPAGCRLHPVFNLDLLKKYVDGRAEFPNRPERFDRPGPVPEEDPAAGGPGAPVYEVERILAARGRGARREYRVLWKGWPYDQASWVSEADCAGCEEAIREFERTQQQIRVQAVRARIARRRAVDTPATRAEAIKAVEENVPRAANRPPIDAKGQIDMGAQRCVADTNSGCWCRLRTKHGCFCWVHRAARDGTQIKKSTIDGAELGLFARRRFKKGEIVARYTGDLIETDAGRDDANGFEGSHYVLELSERVAVDAARTNTADGRMVNDPRGSGRRANVRFSVDQQRKRVTLRATKAIGVGEEFLLSYGRSFWTAPRTARREPGSSREQPIMIGSCRYRINMLGIAHSDQGSPRPGEWHNGKWICGCTEGGAMADNRRSAKMAYCEACGARRPSPPSPERAQQQGAAESIQQSAQIEADSAQWAQVASALQGDGARDVIPQGDRESAQATQQAARRVGRWSGPEWNDEDDGAMLQSAAATARGRVFLLAGDRDDADEEDSARDYTQAPTRSQVWGSAPPLASGALPEVAHGERANAARRLPASLAPAACGDCRGVASLYHPEQATNKVSRVSQRRAGYCRRSKCECCAPTFGCAWCSCIELRDGLCRRCYLDYHVGKEAEAGQFYPPNQA